MHAHDRRMYRPEFLLLLCLWLAGLGPLQAAPRTNWVAAFPVCLEAPVTSLFSYQDHVLTAFAADSVYNSYDGELWGRTNYGFFNHLPLIGENGLFLDIDGSWHRSMSSTDGVTWKSYGSSVNSHVWTAAAYGNGTYVAAGPEGIDYGYGGLFNWFPSDFPQYPGCAGLIYAHDHFVLLSPGQGAWTSAFGGANWQPHPVDPLADAPGEASHWTQLRLANGLCFALGISVSTPANGVLGVSRDGGLTWSVQKPAGMGSLTDVTYADGRYVLVGAGVVGYSDDAQNWTFDRSLTPLPLVGVAHVNGRFIAAAPLKSVPHAARYFSTTFHSADGIHWDSPNHGGSALNAVVATATGFVAVGQHGTILTSTNGVEWRWENSGTTNDLLGVGTGGGLTIATGANGTILTSPDTRTWTRRHANTDPNFAPYNLYGVAYARGRYVTAGAYLTSPDGMDWQPAPGHAEAPLNYARSIIDDGQQFLFITGPAPDAPPTTRNQIGHSTDGLTWTLTDLVDGNILYGEGLAYGHGIYLAVGHNFRGISTNGVNWQISPDYDHLRTAIHVNGGFVAVGEGGRFGYLTNTLSSYPGTIRFAGTLNGVAHKDGVFVAVSTEGQLYYSLDEGGHRLAQAHPLPTGGFQLGFSGVAEVPYRVQYTTDFQTWADLITNATSPLTRPLRILDPEAGMNTQRFYRAVEK